MADVRQMTALMYAAFRGYGAVVECLVRHGADWKAKNQDGKDAKALAAEKQHTHIVQYFEYLEHKPQEAKAAEVADSQQLLPSLVDPITYEVFVDPVVASDNHTYERQSILDWWAECEAKGRPLTSPLTRETMSKELRPNLVVKHILSDLAAQQAAARPRRAGDQPSVPQLSEFRSLAVLGQAFDAISPIQGILHDQSWQLPQVVVLGNENSGKSTLLSRLCMMPLFPADKKLCTRMVIKLCLRRSASKLLRLDVVRLDAENTVERSLVLAIDKAAEDIQAVMLEEVCKENGGQPVGVCRSRMLVLHISSPTVPNLDLVDLPGLLTARVHGEPEDMVQQVRALVESYLDQHAAHSTYLVTVPANTAANQSVAMELIQQRRLEQWTIGVLAKCDLVDVATDSDDEDEDTQSKFQDLIHKLEQSSGDIVRLEPHGYVAVMNKRQKKQPPSGHEALIQQAQREHKWFEQRGLRTLSVKDRLGTDALIDRLQLMYNTYLRESWMPVVFAELEAEGRRLEQADQHFGLPRAHDVESLDAAALAGQVAATVKSIVQSRGSQLVGTLKRFWAADAGFKPHTVGTVSVWKWRARLGQLEQDHRALAERQLNAMSDFAQQELERELQECQSVLRPQRFISAVTPALAACLNTWCETATVRILQAIEQFYSAAWNPCISVGDDPSDASNTCYNINLEGLNAFLNHNAVGSLMELLLELEFPDAAVDDRETWLESCAAERRAVLQRLEAVNSAKRNLLQMLQAPKANA